MKILDKGFVNNVAKALKENRKITIVSHVNPDGDAVGASLALYCLLVKEKYEVSVIIPNEIPSFLKWMPCCDKILITDSNLSESEKVISNAEVIFCLDFNNVNRLDGLVDAYKNSKAIKFLIDHHLEPTVFTDYSYSDHNVSSTSEIVWELIESLGKINDIDKAIAECIYVGMVTDTGSFSYSCNHVKMYNITAELFKLGIDGERIHRLVYDTFTENRMRLLGFCLSDKMKVFPEYQTAYISLTKEDLEKYNYQTGDSEGVVNYALSIKGIEMAVFFIERNENIKISFRSKGKVDVNEIARKYYDGGGHHNASGGYSYTSIPETLDNFEKLLPVIIKK
ncbi:MAG TPA: bifunctional oligoribonuclease/PAP phosphatase NrnA [Bacteroidales bacterium]|nr:bifunctional oligoribonuclease/PAP phosphatase NrnA [Bacteroidales bacterium]HPS18301.1 bifunctional oligoribonuclease/PAP phosphatase NrnA [Bacteroidales bacterium]